MSPTRQKTARRREEKRCRWDDNGKHKHYFTPRKRRDQLFCCGACEAKYRRRRAKEAKRETAGLKPQPPVEHMPTDLRTCRCISRSPIVVNDELRCFKCGAHRREPSTSQYDGLSLGRTARRRTYGCL